MPHLRVLTLVLLGATAAQAQRAPVIRPKAGMVITRSVRITPGVFRLRSRGADSGVITIRGDDVTVDLRGVTLTGTPDSADGDQRTGLAILVDGGNRVTILGGRIRGYQTGIRAVGTTDLALRDNDLSDNWRPRLFSGIGHESLIDWLSFHHDESGEWRRFGAGIALEGVHRGTISGNTVRRGMNGLMLTRSDSLRIEANDFSFNSGLGIGLYRSTDNAIVHNRADFDVRGYSRYYRRGQDSADLLMFEQSSRNTVAFNSMTHGGDGLFLWAGQSTMDTGEGGSNDNLFIGNDFSYAPTNGMEATFSRNTFESNRVIGSDHGLWGGYSSNSEITGNCFARNRVGIAVEHGHDNSVNANVFAGDSTAIFLWADSIEPSDWGYPKHRETRSRAWQLGGNTFDGDRVALRVRQTSRLVESGDLARSVDSLVVMRDTAAITLDLRTGTGDANDGCRSMPSAPLLMEPDPSEPARMRTVSAELPGSPTSRMPRSAILIDEWGPYDWTTPKLWPIDSTNNAPLQVLGPSGRWTVTRYHGLTSLSRGHGASGDTLVALPAPGLEGNWGIELADSAGHPFSFEHFDPIPGWDVQYLAAPGGNVNWSADPFLTRREARLDMMASGPPSRDLPASNWGLLASTEVDLGPGTYTLRAISDDGIRVWVDGQVLIDHWAPHESLVDVTRIGPGHHRVAVQYRQLDGWMELRVEIVRGWVPSTGSPGPH